MSPLSANSGHRQHERTPFRSGPFLVVRAGIAPGAEDKHDRAIRGELYGAGAFGPNADGVRRHDDENEDIPRRSGRGHGDRLWHPLSVYRPRAARAALRGRCRLAEASARPMGGSAGSSVSASIVRDHVLVLHRQEELIEGGRNAGIPAPHMIEFDPQGNVVNSWGDPELLDQRLHSCHFERG